MPSKIESNIFLASAMSDAFFVVLGLDWLSLQKKNV